jgi:hypothetical protein
MGSQILRPETQDAASSSTPEVEFALVLSRMINSVRDDPEQMREIIYELARRKLQEQFTHEDVKEVNTLVKALDVAIQGVEAFSKKVDREEASPHPKMHALAAPPGSIAMEASPVTRPMSVVSDTSRPRIILTAEPPEKIRRFSAPWRYLTVLLIAFAAGIAIQQRGVSFDSLQKKLNSVGALPKELSGSAQVASPHQIPPASEQAVTKLSPVLPSSYGIYAVSGDKLYELELLPGRAPDIRVAVSPAITTPSRTVLSDGHLKFLVFRRDSGTSAADRAEVRVIAKITRAISFDANGKPLVAATDDGWVIRNISQPYRTAPLKDNPDMYEVQSENPEAALTPGRYALILKGQAYDFTVEGSVTDPKQCLERLAATNGSFYSECQKRS